MILQQYIDTAYRVAISEGVPAVNADLIVRQARHESNNFSSAVFLANNNAVGMKVPHVRKTPYVLGAGTGAPASEGDNYARYAQWEDSIRDLVNWLRYNRVDWAQVNTPETYAAWLGQKGYYGAGNDGSGQNVYTAAMVRIRNSFSAAATAMRKHPQATIAVMFIGVCLVSAGVYLYFDAGRK